MPNHLAITKVTILLTHPRRRRSCLSILTRIPLLPPVAAVVVDDLAVAAVDILGMVLAAAADALLGAVVWTAKEAHIAVILLVEEGRSHSHPLTKDGERPIHGPSGRRGRIKMNTK